VTAPHPPGYLSYGHLVVMRDVVCGECGKTFRSQPKRAGIKRWCDECRGSEARLAAKREYDKAYKAKRRKS